MKNGERCWLVCRVTLSSSRLRLFLTPFISVAYRSYPEVSISDWVIAERGEAAETLSFSYVSGPYQARRLANIELRRRACGTQRGRLS